MKRVLLIINPKSGKQKAEKSLTGILNILIQANYIPTVLLTQKTGDGTIYAKNYGADYDLLIAVGGDGTFNEVLEGVMDHHIQTPLGYIPAGSTNDFAASLQLSGNLLTATEDIIYGRPQPYDIGKFNNRYFSYVASFGAFTKTSYSTPQYIKNALGHTAYILEGIKDLPSIRKISLEIETPNQTYCGDYIFGAVSNSTSLGGMLKLDPSIVDMNDGFFEIMLIKVPYTPLELQSVLLALTTKKYTNCNMIDFIHTAEAVFRFEQSVPWSLDGEYEPGDKTVTIRNLFSAIQLMVRPHE